MLLPAPKEHGGSPVGNSYVSLWLNCRAKWFYEHHWPSFAAEGEIVSRGLAPLDTAPPLLTGSMFHAAKAAYWRSGIRDGEDTGEYLLDAAVAGAEAESAARRDEYPSDEARQDDLTVVGALMRNYHEYFGPGGYRPLYPEIKMLCDLDGEPLVEREFWTPVGDGYVATCRADAITLYQGRYLRVDEHKTSAPGFWANQMLNGLAKASQFTHEMYVLAQSYPDHLLEGVAVNVHYKGWSKPTTASPLPMKTAVTTRTPDQLDRFATRIRTVLREIENTVGQFETALAEGVDFGYALSTYFPETGEHTGQCYAYNRECPFMGPCRTGRHDGGVMGGYRPTRRIEQ